MTCIIFLSFLAYKLMESGADAFLFASYLIKLFFQIRSKYFLSLINFFTFLREMILSLVLHTCTNIVHLLVNYILTLFCERTSLKQIYVLYSYCFLCLHEFMAHAFSFSIVIFTVFL